MINEKNINRVIFDLGDPSKKTVIFVAALHGNEQAGIIALQFVQSLLQQKKIPLAGRVVGLLGNIRAMQKNKRYITYDLNRLWTKKWINTPLEKQHEDVFELHQLKNKIDSIIEQAKDTLIIDLHTMSSEGIPFICFWNTKINRKISYLLPIPAILGLVRHLKGTLVDFYTHKKRIPAICFETGQHTSPSAVENAKAFIWEILIITSIIDKSNKPHLEKEWNNLIEKVKKYPTFVRILYKKEIHPNEKFKMLQGFENLSPIKKEQPLAKNKKGTIRARFNGLLLLPLYQKRGSEGFFIGREVSPFILKVMDIFRKQ